MFSPPSLESELERKRGFIFGNDNTYQVPHTTGPSRAMVDQVITVLLLHLVVILPCQQSNALVGIFKTTFSTIIGTVTHKNKYRIEIWH